MVVNKILFINTASLAICLYMLLPPAFGEVDTAWVRKYNGQANGQDKAVALAVDGSGNVYVTGSSSGTSTSLDYTTVKYLPNGDTAWARRYNGTSDGEDQATAIVLDGFGNVLVTGFSWGGVTDYDYVTIKYDLDGNELWARRYDGPAGGEDKAYAIVADGYGAVYVTGKSAGDGTSDDYATIRYQPDGDTGWISRYNGTGNNPDQALALAVDHFRNVYVSGCSWGGLTNLDYATVKYDSTGNQVWAERYNGPADGQDRASGIALDDSGYVYVTGYSTGIGSLRDYLTIKYYAHGDTVWSRRYDGPASDRDEAKALTVDGSGNIYVTGYSWDYGTNLDCATVKYLPNGDAAWVRRYNGPADAGDYGRAVATHACGNVYVTGSSQGNGTGQDYVTIGYSPGGDTLWVKSYDGDAAFDDGALAVVVDAGGNVYVTGYCQGSASQADYVTIKYARTHEIPSMSRAGLFILAILLTLLAATFIIIRKGSPSQRPGQTTKLIKEQR